MLKTIVLCDDEPEELTFMTKGLTTCARQLNKELNIIALSEAQDCLEYIFTHDVSAVFLDIYIGNVNGCDLGHQIRQFDPHIPIVFVTSSTDFALEAFTLSAKHYLVKPVTLTQIEETIKRLDLWPSQKEKLVELQPGLAFPEKNIMYFEVTNRHIMVHLNNNQEFSLKTTLASLEDLVDKQLFLRCHRSFLVNMNYIEKATDTDFILKNGDKLPIRLNGGKQTKEIFYDYLFSIVRK